MADDINFAQGLYWNPPHQNAPDFVLGGIAIRPKEFVDWLREQKPDSKGYIRMAVKRSKAGKDYVALDTFEPKPRQEQPPSGGGGGWDEDVPF